MASKPISAMTQFTPLGRMLMPVVDPAAATGNKNGSVLLGALISMLGADLATLQADSTMESSDSLVAIIDGEPVLISLNNFLNAVASMGGTAALAGSGMSVGAAGASFTAGTAIDVVGSVSPGGTPVQVAIGPSNTVAPTSGWTAATVNGTGFTASITEATAGTYYIWAQQAENAAVQVVSAAVTVTAPP